MATLPPGWVADYDGSRWFFVYEPTGQSQYQFPKPGDEFPDFGGGLALGLGDDFPVMELPPEERLESERQVRRQSARATGATRERDVDGKDHLKQEVEDEGGEVGGRLSKGVGKDDDADGGTDVFYFESFGYLGPTGLDFGREGPTIGKGNMKGRQARGHQLESGPPPQDIGPPYISPPTSVNNTPRASISEPSAIDSFSSVTVELAVEATKHPNSPAPPELDKTQPAMAIAEPAAAVADMMTTGLPSAQPGAQGDRQLQGPTDYPPMLDGRPIDSVPRMLTFSPVRFIPELYSELTALCEDEINPPPAELPDNGARWLEPVPVPNFVNQYPVELPVGGHVPSGEGEVCDSGLEGKQPCIVPGNGDDEPGKGLGRRADSEERGGVCKQMSDGSQVDMLPPKPPPKESLDEFEALHQEIMGYFPVPSATPASQGQQPIPQKQIQASTPLVTGTEDKGFNIPPTRGLIHVPSVLRPGPRRSSQPPPLQQTFATGAAHKAQAHVGPAQQLPPKLKPASTMPSLPLRGRHNRVVQQEEDRQAVRMPRHNTMLAELPSQASFQSIPIGPPVDRPRPVAAGKRQAAAAAVNFVIPIDHRPSLCDPYGSAATAAAQEMPMPEYHVSATFASRPPTGRQREDGRVHRSGSPLPGEGPLGPPWSQPAATTVGVAPHLLTQAGPTRASPPEWSWGYAK